MKQFDFLSSHLVKRFRLLNKKDINCSYDTIIYWMERDQRVSDNWALITAAALSEKFNLKLKVLFNYDPEIYGNQSRRIEFVKQGLLIVNQNLSNLNIMLEVTIGDSYKNVITKITEENVAILVCDFNPIKPLKYIKKKLAENLDIPIFEVDAHNIIPAWEASKKEEIGARTLRLKINNMINEYLVDFPTIIKKEKSASNISVAGIEDVFRSMDSDASVSQINWLEPGEDAALTILQEFLENKLSDYVEKRNDPTEKFISNLSPYLHFGHISAQRIAMILYGSNDINVESFLEELIIRRELSDNYLLYNSDYDNFEGFPNWAKLTLNNHRKDERDFLYSIEEFENMQTHDDLWNAAQNELTTTGKMHGYMRMYWAKKILEWSNSPEEAQNIAIYLNDKYAIDGVDPNGYTGIAWSIGGVHDRAWAERPVYGKVRYMNYNGCKRKFDIQKYIMKFNN